MAFTVISDSFKDGDYLAKKFILSADFGFGCAGDNKSPHLKWPDAVRSGISPLSGRSSKLDAPEMHSCLGE